MLYYQTASSNLIEEIAAMKLETITGREVKKDFFDIAFLPQEFSLKFLLQLFRIKYPFLDKMMCSNP